MKDLVSVIVPMYNREDVVGECIESVLAQSYQNFEIVLIDDGSVDNSVEICQKYAESDLRIKVLNAEHGGVSAARNLGIEVSEGEFVFFLDSDDVIHPQLLDTLVTALKNSDAAMAGTEVLNVKQKSWYKVKERIDKSTSKGETTYYNHEETLEKVFSSSTPFAVIGGVMMRRDLIGDTRFCTDIYISEDFYFIYQNLIKGANTIFLKQKWYYVRLHDSNSSWDFGYSGFWTRFYSRKMVWESEESLGRTEYANRQKKSGFYCFIVCIQKNKPYSEDSKKMRKVLREYKADLLAAMGLKGKLVYLMCAYLPLTTFLFFKFRSKLSKRK